MIVDVLIVMLALAVIVLMVATVRAHRARKQPRIAHIEGGSPVRRKR